MLDSKKFQNTEKTILNQLSLKFDRITRKTSFDVLCFENGRIVRYGNANSSSKITKYITNSPDDLKEQFRKLEQDFYNKIIQYANEIVYIDILHKNDCIEMLLTDGTKFIYDPVIAQPFPLVKPLDDLDKVLSEHCKNILYTCDIRNHNEKVILFLDNITGVLYYSFDKTFEFYFKDNFNKEYVMLSRTYDEMTEHYSDWMKEQLADPDSDFSACLKLYIKDLKAEIREGREAEKQYADIKKRMQKKYNIL